MSDVLVALYDRVAKRHVQVMLMPNVETAKRAFVAALKSDKYLFENHHDFDVFVLSEMNIESGALSGVRHQHLFALTELVPAVQS